MSQFNRAVKLILADSKGAGKDFSSLRIKFKVEKTDAQTPNKATVSIYNVAPDTYNQIKKEFSRVILQAGYQDNNGVIFDGFIKQVRIIKEGVDRVIEIYAGDGDVAYNYTLINKTLSAGANSSAIVGELGKSMGINTKFNDATGLPLPRGKTMFGQPKHYLREVAKTNDSSWSIQDGQLQVLKTRALLPNEAVKLNSQTGMIGTPTQEVDGIKVKALINPLFRIGGAVIINQNDITEAVIDDNPKDKDKAAEKPMPIEANGAYKIIKLEFSGDTHGTDWYADILAIGIDRTAKKKTTKETTNE